MIDHLGLAVSDVRRSVDFYLRALEPLGYRKLFEHPISGTAIGPAGKPIFWLREGTPSPGLHLAFAAADAEAVRAFHRAALAAGGTDNGPPGLRPEYHARYFGAFVLDLDGHNIEAVCHSH